MKTLTDNQITICGHGCNRPSTKNLEVYSTTRYNQRATNGVHKGIVEVRRHAMMTDEKRKKFVDTYKTILGRNIYSQEKRQYVYSKCGDGKYYSDCSSSGMATYKKIGLDTGGLLNTAGIHSSGKFTTVPVTIKNGHITDPWKLEVGDCILFAGSDPSRPKQIGHVEYVYNMPGSKCSIKKKCCIYQKKDQTARHIATHFDGDTVRILEDCKDGWSLCTDGVVIGYIKNSCVNRVGLSGYLKGTINKDTVIKESNSKTSRNIMGVAAGTAIQIVTMRKNWTYMIAKINGVSVKGWVPTKYVSYK